MAADPTPAVLNTSASRTVSALPRSRPSDQGVDPAAIDGLLDAVERAGIELHSLMVLRHGAVVAEGWWSPYSADGLHLLYSLSKSFTSAAAGLAIAEGRFGLDDLVLDHLGEFAPDGVDERFRLLKVRHALSMATGHEHETAVQAVTWCLHHSDPEMLHGFFTIPPERDPGTVFAYNQPATYCAARIVEKTTGQRVEQYLTPRLFEPLGIADHFWLTENGHNVGYSGLHLTTESIAKLGQLCLQLGEWNGEQLLPADWVRQATAVQMPNDAAHQVEPPALTNPDWLQGYGFQFWMSQHGYRGDGACGQFCLVWPEQDAVIVTTAAVVDMQALLTMIEQQLLPGMNGSGSDTVAEDVAAQEDRLSARLAGLALPIPQQVGGGTVGTFRRSAAGMAAAAAKLADPTAESDVAAPELSSLALSDSATGWELELTLPSGPIVLPIGRAGWAAGNWPGVSRDGATGSVLFESAGGWHSDGIFEATLVMIQTPHAIRLLLDPATGKFDASWQLPPLRGASPSEHLLSRSGSPAPHIPTTNTTNGQGS